VQVGARGLARIRRQGITAMPVPATVRVPGRSTGIDELAARRGDRGTDLTRECRIRRGGATGVAKLEALLVASSGMSATEPPTIGLVEGEKSPSACVTPASSGERECQGSPLLRSWAALVIGDDRDVSRTRATAGSFVVLLIAPGVVVP